MLGGMKRFARGWRAAALQALVAAALGACDDPAVVTQTRSVRLVEPLTMSWTGSQAGALYPLGETAIFRATAELRVAWSFRIEAPSGAHYSTSMPLQEHIEFTWRGQAAAGSPAFASGDSCTASVHFGAIDPQDATAARLGFVVR